LIIDFDQRFQTCVHEPAGPFLIHLGEQNIFTLRQRDRHIVCIRTAGAHARVIVHLNAVEPDLDAIVAADFENGKGRLLAFDHRGRIGDVALIGGHAADKIQLARSIRLDRAPGLRRSGVGGVRLGVKSGFSSLISQEICVYRLAFFIGKGAADQPIGDENVGAKGLDPVSRGMEAR